MQRWFQRLRAFWAVPAPTVKPLLSEMPRQPLLVYRRVITFVKPYWKTLGTLAILEVITTPLGATWPFLTQQVIDRVPNDLGVLLPLLLIALAVVLVQTILDAIASYIKLRAESAISRDVQAHVASHLYGLDLAFLNEQRPNRLLRVVQNDAPDLPDVITRTPIDILGLAVSFATGLVAVFLISPSLGIFVIVMTLPMAILSEFLGSRGRDFSHQQSDASGEAMANFAQSIHEIRTVKAYDRIAYELSRYRHFLENARSSSLREKRLSLVVRIPVRLFDWVPAIVTLGYAGTELAAGRMTAGQVGALIGYVSMLTGPISSGAWKWQQIRRDLASADRVFGLLDTKPTITDGPSAHALVPTSSTISFDNVTFGYQPDAPVLRNFTLDVPAGKTVAIVGRSGVGKTTLFSLISRLYEIQSGAIYVGGSNISEVTQTSLREQFSYVPQEPVLFSSSVLENVRYGRLEATDAEVETALEAACALDFVRALPQGVQTLVGERGVLLSVGQRQRVALARALLRNAPIVLLDEATSALDNESEYTVQTALNRLLVNRTVLLIAHRLSTVEHADLIAYVEDGRVAELGTHRQLLAQEGRYWQLYRRSFNHKPDLEPVLV